MLVFQTKARNSTVSKVTQMFNFAFDQTVELEKRKQVCVRSSLHFTLSRVCIL